MDFWDLCSVNYYLQILLESPFRKKTQQDEIKAENIATRFVALFESHGIHRNQIPSFFDHTIDLHDCANEAELLKKLNTQTLKDAAVLFGVNLEWLQGASTEIYDIPSFYKDNEACEEYLSNLKFSKPDANFSAYVLTSNTNKHNRDTNNAVILITEVIGYINEREIYRYRLVGKTQNTYWKARAYFAVSCALLIKYGFQPIGQAVNEQWLVSLNGGKTLIKYDFTEGYQDFILPNGSLWYVDEFLECPEKYLAGVDPERNNFGHISALEMWLGFKHFMKIDGEHSYEQAQTLFIEKLRIYSCR